MRDLLVKFGLGFGLMASVQAGPQNGEAPSQEREALKQLARQLGPPAVIEINEEQFRKLFEQYLKDPANRKRLDEFLKNNPHLAANGRNGNLPIDPQTITPDQLDAIRNMMLRPPGEKPPRTDPLIQPQPPDVEPLPRPPVPRIGPEPPDQGNPIEPGASRPWPVPSTSPTSPPPGIMQGYQQVAQLWERFVGPLNRTPAVQKFLQQVIFNLNNGPSGAKRASWVNGSNNQLNFNAKPSWFMRQLNKLGQSSTWDFKFLDFHWSPGNVAPPDAGSGSSFSGVPLSDLSLASPGTFVYVLGFIVIAVVLYYLLRLIAPGMRKNDAAPQPIDGLGPWPIDPRTITDREGLVAAFEYLSLAICGSGARVWNHSTIAEALRQRVPHAAKIAAPLASYYCLARYSPADDPFTPTMIQEARSLLCRLAGVSAP